MLRDTADARTNIERYTSLPPADPGATVTVQLTSQDLEQLKLLGYVE